MSITKRGGIFPLTWFPAGYNSTNMAIKANADVESAFRAKIWISNIHSLLIFWVGRAEF